MVSTLVHSTNITRKMFKPGNKYGALTKRGVNKTSKETKELINEILFNREEFITDWQQMDIRERMELRIKMARFVMPEPKEEAKSGDDTDYPLFVDTREDALRLLDMTENGEEQVGDEIVFE